MKVLLSRSCEIMPYAELDKPIIEKDKEFAELITRVLESCKKWKTIKPTRTNLIGENYELTALGAYVDGGLPAFGGSVYFLSTHRTTKERESMIAASKSKVSNRTVPANGALARRLGMDILIKIVECLVVDPEVQLKPIEIILYGDSSCVASLFNPTLAIKNSLLRTAVYGTIQRVKTILEMMPNALIYFSWIAGTDNAADFVSKVFIDPIAAMNSDLFRHGGTFMLTKRGSLHENNQKGWCRMERYKQ